MEPVQPRPAATIALIRDGESGIETWMMRRSMSMAFASGALVFPGGGVDPRDSDTTIPWAGVSPDELGLRLGVATAEARAVGNAAARELFEEAGVLTTLRGTQEHHSAKRRAVEAKELTLADLLSAEGESLAMDRFAPWGRWVTPASESRRYDTWFFVCSVTDQVDLSPSAEAVEASWVSVAEALETAARQDVLVLPPTIAVLRSLRDAGSVDGALRASAERDMSPVDPRIVDNADGTVSVFGWGEEVVVRVAR